MNEETVKSAGLSEAKRLLLEKRLRGVADAGAARAVSRPTQGPLSFAQQRLWFLHQWDPESSAYNVPQAWRIRAPLDVPALERAFVEVVRRHDVLRTTYRMAAGEPEQVVQPVPARVLEVVDAREDEDAFLRRLAVEAARPFDLTEGPVFRATLYRRPGGDHVLFLNVHHIAYDGWSIGIFFGDLGAAYEALRAGRPLDLPPVASNYVAYAQAQRSAEAQARVARQLDYWRRQLEDLPVLDLPLDKRRPATRRHRGEHVGFELDARLAARLRAFCEANGITPFMALYAAFTALLQRYTGQDDVAVGTPVAGRGQPASERLVGFFVNTLVLRADLSGDPSFLELARRARDVALDAFSNQEAPFERVVDELETGRDLSRSPLFQVLFTLQNASTSTLALGSVELETVPIPIRTSKFDLTLVLQETRAGLWGMVEYDVDLFEAASISAMIARFERLLAAVLERPDLPVSRAVLVDDAELASLAPPARPPLPETRVHRLFERQAARAPDRVAVESEGRALTYGELDAAASRLAARLRAAGARRGSLVGIHLPRGIDAIVATFATLKAGAGYVPLDPAYPEERRRFMAKDAALAVVVTDEANAGFGAAPEVLVGDDAATAPLAPEDDGSGEDVAYVMYTSGSTGTPKGVVVPHRGVARLVMETDYVEFGPEHVFLHAAPTAFDASTFEVWGALLHGARLVVLPPGPSSLADVGRAIQAHGVTTLWLTAPLFHLMVEDDLPSLHGVRQLIAGGDALSPAHVFRAKEALPACRIVNGYGPTEVTTFACCHTVTDADRGRATIPIGRPIANTWAYVLDARGAPVPPGLRGELHLGGPGVALGYLNRPELTAQRFLPDPHVPGATMYRTGDVVRQLPDGSFEFLGRADDQVKVRGFRIELGEVESALAALPGVREAAALAVPDASGAKSLVAFVASDEPGAGPKLRARLRERLPDFMVPVSIGVVRDMPRTATGKIDRRALAALPQGTASARASSAPRTPTETALARIWRDLLRVDDLGIEDDFFERGGHSLLATRLVSRIRSDLGVEMTLRQAFQEPTIARLAALVDELAAQGSTPQAPILRRARKGPVAPSYGQQRLWFLHEWDRESPAYNVPHAVRLSGPLDEAALDRALVEIVTRHEALRTTFRLVGGKPAQEAGPAPARLLVVEDVASEADLHARLRDEARRPFDLERGPVLRAHLFRRSPEERVLLLNAHHVAYDGWSVGILAQELETLYRAFRDGRPSPLAPLPVQYADYALWQRQWLDGEALRAQLDYWGARLRDATPLDLPTDRPRPAVQSSDGAVEAFRIPAQVAEALHAFCRQEEVTPFMALLAAYQALLHRWSGQADVTVGTPVAGRTRAETEGLIGFFVNTLALRADLADDPSFVDLVRRTKESCLGAYANQDVPFEKLVELLEPERDVSRSPIFQAMFSLQNAPGEPLRLDGVRAEPVAIPYRSSKFDLNLALAESSGGIDGALTYSTALFDADTVRRMTTHFVALLCAALRDPARRVGDLDLLPPEERALVQAWSGTTAMREARFVQDMVAQHAALRPDAPALACGGVTLTFAELDGRAERLAARLQALGVGPDALVALLAERSIDTVVGMLAVLKAGGAYVPLDPAQPDERLRFVVEDTQPQALLAPRHALARLPAHDATVLVDEPASWGAPEPRRAPALTPDHLAYVIYTSGSTGQPKGVMVRHEGLSNYVAWALATPLLAEGNGTLVPSSLAFDLALTGLYPTLGAGKRVALLPESAGPEDLADALLAEDDLSFVKLTPSHLKLVEHGLDGRALDGHVRAFVTGGEALTGDHVRPWRALAPRLRFLNHYGPTETVIGCCTTWVEPADLDAPTVPIGRPIPNLRAYVVDAKRRLVPIGVRGELLVAGAAVARGYHRRPDLTAERFVEDPLRPGERAYRTGDLVRWRPDGRIEFLGRLDHQVKVRGYRVELGEVESALRDQSGVEEAVVLARDVAGQRRLVAYVVSAAPQVAAWKEALKARLPEYMVPSIVMPLDRLPLNANGKVDRKRLPEPESERAEGAASFVAPRDATERVLAEAWAEVLRLDRVGVEDNYFDLGGDSIMSIQIIVRCAQRGVRFTPKQLFQHQTIAELAKVSGASSVAQADQGLVTGPLPLTPIQRYFFDRALPEPHHFNLSFLMEVPEDVEPKAMEEAAHALLRHHDALRLRYRRQDGAWTQDHAEPASLSPFRLVDLSDVPASDQAARLEAHAAETQRGFTLEDGSIARFVLFDLGPGRRKKLLFAVHHLAVDAVSWRILLEDLETAYRQVASGQAPRLPPKTTSFRRWAEALTEYARAPELLAEAPYWARAAGQGASLPLDMRGENTQASFDGIELFFDPEETRALLHDVPRAYRTQINDVLLTAFSLAFRRWTGDDALLVELEGHGREDVVQGVDISRTVGWFTVLFPVLLRLPRPDDLGASLVEVKETLRALPNRGIGYGVLRYLSDAPETEAVRQVPTPPVRFNYLGVFDPVAATGDPFLRLDASSRGWDQGRGGMRTQLIDVNGSVTGGRLRLRFGYSANLHRRETIERLTQDFATALRDLIAHCAARARTKEGDA